MLKIIQCQVCHRPMRYREAHLSKPGTPAMEDITCAYTAHIAGQSLTDGYWIPVAMSPADQEEWLRTAEGNSGVGAEGAVETRTLGQNVSA